MGKEERGGLGPLCLKVSNVFFSVPPLVVFARREEKVWEDGFVQSSRKRLAIAVIASPRTEYLCTEQLLCNHLQHTGESRYTFTESKFIHAVSKVN